jgi:hypothetical protein
LSVKRCQTPASFKYVSKSTRISSILAVFQALIRGVNPLSLKSSILGCNTVELSYVLSTGKEIISSEMRGRDRNTTERTTELTEAFGES